MVPQNIVRNSNLITRNILILLLVLVVLAGVFYIVSRPKGGTPVQPTEFVWLIEEDEIEHVTITLPRENPVLSQSFIRIKHDDDFPWFFDDEARTPVNSGRWGGGIPLLLSGPGADRVISYSTTVDKLTEYGLMSPKMKIDLILSDNKTMQILVGDKTPNGNFYYVKAPDANAVAVVDYTWYDVLSKIVTDPPYTTTEKSK